MQALREFESHLTRHIFSKTLLMFFVLSKIFWILCSPVTLATIGLAVGGFFYARNMGRALLKFSVLFLCVIGFFPVGQNLLVYLENTHPVPAHLPAKVDGIIILGGSIDLKTSIARDQIILNENASRLTEMMALARQYPKAKIVFSGGDGNLIQSSSSESEKVDNLLKNIGLNALAKRVLYEGKSRNTYENMVYARDMVNPRPADHWVLVTSAFHMPRSAAIFASHGWAVTPYPVGYLTDGKYHILPGLDVLGNMYKFQVAAREIIGIMAYTLTGKIRPYADTNEKGTDTHLSGCADCILQFRAGRSVVV